jgi:hypothetical protein
MILNTHPLVAPPRAELSPTPEPADPGLICP